MSVDAILALGSNLGESRDTLEGAVRLLAEHPRIELIGRSPVAVTAPVGGPADQPDYLNMVVAVRTDLRPFALLRWCQEIEHRFHRARTVRWGPRTLDVDVIVYGALHMDEPELVLPHPRAAQRAFVLAPWARMDPQALLDGVSVAALAERAPDAEGLRGWLGEDGALPVEDSRRPPAGARPGAPGGHAPFRARTGTHRSSAAAERRAPWAAQAGSGE